MQKVTDRLFIGSLDDCTPEPPDGFAVVHACRNPCYCKKVGKQKPGTEFYLSLELGQEQWLNIIDPPTPLFKLESFTRYLAFAAAQWQQGLSILIHCNQGRSRAPSLALLFAAKCLGALPDASYDEAWDRFEELLGGSYEPGAGIETYLRTHWLEIKGQRIGFIPGAATEPVQQVTAPFIPETLRHIGPATTAEALASVIKSPLVHFFTATRIRDKDGKLTPEDAHIAPTVFQHRACEAYEWCLANDIPIRLVLGPKPRQSGGSTISAELCLHHTQRFGSSGMVIGDENDRTDLLWDMFNEMADKDRVRNIWGTRHDWNTEKAHFISKRSDGTEHDALWLRDTANDPKAGASGTRQVLWFSEAGRYSKEGKATDRQVISNASSSVPERPGTLIIMESTAEGAAGAFYETVIGAVTLEERMAGHVGNGWIKVSCWWHECPDYVLPRTPDNEGWFSAALDVREKRGVELYSWTADQIAWRRKKIKMAFGGNVKLFDQEFPESESVAFSSSGNPRFDIDGMTRLEKLAGAGHQTAQVGTLERNNNVTQFTANTESPWLWMKEPPMYGARYIFFADCMTGEQSSGSVVRDTHAGGVWRAPYKDPAGQMHNALLVAAIDVPGGCRWDEDIFAERAHFLSQFYGGCIMAVEVNQALGVIRELINRSANLWKRTKADEASGIAGKTIKIPGWNTTPGASGSRTILVSDLAKAIREETLDIHFLPLIHQLKVFVQHENGSCSAKAGEHDDWVLGCGIGVSLMSAATEYKPPKAILPTSHVPVTGGYRSKGAAALG